MENKTAYDLKSVKLPYLSGGLLRLFTALVEGPLGGLILPSLFESAGLTWLRRQVIEEAPTHHPIHYRGAPAEKDAAVPQSAWPEGPAAEGSGFHFASVFDYARAYREGRTTPEEVAEKYLQAVEAGNASTPPLRAVINVQRDAVMRQARESTARIQAGKALSLFDGVPVAVKDELDLVPYPTTVGTAFLGKSPAQADSAIAARMRAAGAVMAGKTNMHEIGINVTGLNPHHGTTRNPYDPGHFTGGSSSGSATAVAAASSGELPRIPVSPEPVERRPVQQPRTIVFDDADDDLDVPDFLK